MSSEDNLNSSDTWLQCMRAGKFEEAWKFSDKVVQSGINRDYQNLPRHFQCIWDGTPLRGKRVLVRCYHGLGDTIQFIRYIPLVKQIAHQVIVWAQPALLKLLKSVEGIDRLLPLHDGVPDVDYDVDVEVMELPHVFRTTSSTIPLHIPYMHADPLELLPRNQQLSVGLVWKAGDWDQSRAIPYPILEPLSKIQGINLYIVQPNAIAAGWQEGFGIYHGEFNISDYARVLKDLDLLITIDSMPAHLAGALNIPVWTLLPAEADWRWMENRDDSPWYPSMRLFRQQVKGEWTAVIDTVTAELKKLVLNQPA